MESSQSSLRTPKCTSHLGIGLGNTNGDRGGDTGGTTDDQNGHELTRLRDQVQRLQELADYRAGAAEGVGVAIPRALGAAEASPGDLSNAGQGIAGRGGEPGSTPSLVALRQGVTLGHWTHVGQRFPGNGPFTRWRQELPGNQLRNGPRYSFQSQCTWQKTPARGDGCRHFLRTGINSSVMVVTG